MVIRRFVTGLLAAMVTAVPAVAWEFGVIDDQTFWTGVRDSDGKTQLIFFCTQAMPGVIQLQILTPEPGPPNPVAVELAIVTGDGTFGPITARATSLQGNLSVATTGVDLEAMNAAQSVYASSGPITVTYYESTWHYPGANSSDAFGAVLDACG